MSDKIKTIKFKDHPEFTPNLTPSQMFKMGSFGGTYFRPIYSSITDKHYKKVHHKFPKSWWRDISEDWLSRPYDQYDKSINKYKVKVGSTLEFWEDHGWITKTDPYGWVQWYCNFYNGRRTDDDERQIKRWLSTAGPNSRFRKWLINQIASKDAKYNDFNISPKIRQTLQHWGYILTKKDFDNSL